MNTVLVTGGSGFLAKHIIHHLLLDGYNVRATVRGMGKAVEIERAVASAIPSPSSLEFAQADLMVAQGWAEAMADCDAVIHTASPFPATQPRDERELIEPAVSGTRTVLNAAAAAGITRIVLTSSIAAMIYPAKADARLRIDEGSWTDVNYPGLTPYAKSKTLAERAAWDFVQTSSSRIDLTVVNPGFIVGPPLDAGVGTSLATIQRLLKGSDPMLPNFGFPTVDVRDVADMHVRALSRPETVGKRLVASEQFIWYADMAQLLKVAYPHLPIVSRRGPNIVIRLLSMFDASAKTILPDLGRRVDLDNSQTLELLSFEFRDAKEALLAAADQLLKLRLA